MTMRGFLVTVSLVFLGLLAATAAFNVLVDADGLFNAPKIDGFNAVKSQVAFRTQSIQPLRVAWRKPQALILGSSRAGSGLRVSMLPWSKHLNTYNAAVEGSGIYTELQMYRHAQAVSRGGVKKVLLTLDFLGFNDNYAKNNPHSLFVPSYNKLLAVHADGAVKHLYILRLLDLTLKEALSEPALKRSIKTIQTQKSPSFVYKHDGAFPPVDTPGRRYRAAYMEVEKAFFDNLLFGSGSYVMRPHGRALEYYKTFLERLHKDHVQAILMINPTHAGTFSMLSDAGVWPCFQRWKGALLRIDRTVAQKTGGKPFPLWDFAYVQKKTLEPVPPKGDQTSEMMYWWDIAHYKASLGNIVVKRIFESRRRHDKQSYGVLLNSVNMKRWENKVSAGRKEFRKEQPKLAASIRNMAEKWMANHRVHISCPASLADDNH